MNEEYNFILMLTTISSMVLYFGAALMCVMLTSEISDNYVKKYNLNINAKGMIQIAVFVCGMMIIHLLIYAVYVSCI